MESSFTIEFSHKEVAHGHNCVCHNHQFTSRDANDGKDHEERGGEDRAKHENPDIDVVDPIMVPSVDAGRNDNEVGEESINLMVDTLEVSIEDVEFFALVPMDCSLIEDGVPPLLILPLSDEQQAKEVWKEVALREGDGGKVCMTKNSYQQKRCSTCYLVLAQRSYASRTVRVALAAVANARELTVVLSSEAASSVVASRSCLTWNTHPPHHRHVTGSRCLLLSDFGCNIPAPEAHPKLCHKMDCASVERWLDDNGDGGDDVADDIMEES
ncbi:F-box protein [Cucumis melo var. makuwa]|uniref:F-box protein n=1 Tax=Cucumis melo var. makuwa TaxID=1194695 RepID=A0A5D3BBE8_CUCMM|nr:F-box protein [Cucumis melo var. makuwa]